MHEELFTPKKENYVTSVPMDYGGSISSAVSRIDSQKPERKLFHYDDKTASSINSAMEEMNKPLKGVKKDLRDVK